MQNKSIQTHPMMTVVIPVYNKADDLKCCIESIRNQTASSNSYEVVLVNDGSTDNSLEICRQLESEHDFIRVITQENQGVSAARNTGIQASSGKYIMFLDADDSINEEAIEKLINSFELFGTDVDVVAYRMKYYYPASKNSKRHKRETWLKETGLYPLDEFPFVAQSTMNICIRNRFEDNILFDQTMKMGEDQLFVSNNLVRTGILGYCAEAEYCYVRDGFNTSTRGNNPLYAFDDMAKLYESLLTIAQSNEIIASYAYQLILYNYDWRIKSSMLFPTDPNEQTNKEQRERLNNITQQIPIQEIIDSPYLNAYHKVMLLDHFDSIRKP